MRLSETFFFPREENVWILTMMQFAVVSCWFVCICLRFSFFFFQTIVRILSLYKSSDYRNVDDGRRDFFKNNYKTQTISLVSKRFKLI